VQQCKQERDDRGGRGGRPSQGVYVRTGRPGCRRSRVSRGPPVRHVSRRVAPRVWRKMARCAGSLGLFSGPPRCRARPGGRRQVVAFRRRRRAVRSATRRRRMPRARRRGEAPAWRRILTRRCPSGAYVAVCSRTCSRPFRTCRGLDGRRRNCATIGRPGPENLAVSNREGTRRITLQGGGLS
jgi:hypothetical protein